jgi:hypothetical protein
MHGDNLGIEKDCSAAMPSFTKATEEAFTQ